MNATAEPAAAAAPVARIRPKCPRCGSSLHRSRARTLREKFLRRVLGLKKYRCDGCGHRQWKPGSGTREPRPSTLAPLVAAEKRRKRRDPIARRATKRRWRRAALTAILVVGSGLMLGMYIARQYSNTPVQQVDE